MRRVRDYDAELKALAEKARELKARKVEQLGALVVATGADALDLEVIAGMLRQGVMEAKQESVKESWRADGAMFLGKRGRKGRPKAGSNQKGDGEKPRGEAAG
ncbi:MAG: conjugal transfer protein TraD [Parasphingorhabdus sp.]|nr:conjugal transfer protein TraD [Parasphingorhabdus sp.]